MTSLDLIAEGLRPGAARVDAPQKVRGTARFGADHVPAGLGYAVLAVASVARGRITKLDTAAARRVPGVRLVLTSENLGRVRSPGYAFTGGLSNQSLVPLTTDRIRYRGQPIACVVADSFEAAREAAALVRAEYSTRSFVASIHSERAERVDLHEAPVEVPRLRAGNAARALARAAGRVDQTYEAPAQHNNPMELLSTVAEWRDGALLIHEATQNTGAVRFGVAEALRIPPERVRVVSPYIGGGFGQRNFVMGHTILAAVAARRLKRPVKLVMTRQQIFNAVTFRPAHRARVRLGADASGRLTAAIHETISQTSNIDVLPTTHADTSTRLYGIPDIDTREFVVRTDTQTPGYMRTPFEHVAAFAIESAVDELALAMRQDPVQMRLRSDTRRDAITGKPLSSRHLNACLERGARRFGWAQRNPQPRSMRAPDGAHIGYGVAAGAYPNSIAPAVATLRATDEGDIFASVGVHDMGQGARNAVAGAVAEVLGVPVGAITVELGDTNGPPQHLTAGSWGTTTAVPAAHRAAVRLLRELRELDQDAGRGRSPAQVLRRAGRRALAVEARNKAPEQSSREAFGALREGAVAVVGPEFEDFVSFSYVAHFVEVRVEPTTRRVRVPRVVSVVDCGRVMSRRTAISQVHGGVIWGIGATLREVSEVDERYGGFLNNDLAEYVIPCNADIGEIHADFIDEPDDVLTSTGVKNLGEVTMAGVAPAITNAIHHAIGRRFRRLPVRLDDLFG